MSVKSLADIWRTGFDLDVLIPRRPRHSSIVSMNDGWPAVTPSRTLVPNELEYLDVFDFSTSHACHLAERMLKARQTATADPDTGRDASDSQMTSNEFNITNFLMDASSDWLFKQEERSV
ncbi:hypothetical protein E4U43_002000 [Claviceps pusilla]|uniref:Uncharacterized protein n=1 Tax=Claviceps pusilla TaxID=123648 RepID=A0A9P7N7Q4_9HYPO|nr:hypothetical protein E4U43_002000 [Claviceps pusilla]